MYKEYIYYIYVRIYIYKNLYIKNIYVYISEVNESRSVVSPTLYDPMDYTVQGILQARILE